MWFIACTMIAKKHVQYRSKVSYHPSSPFSRDETLVSRDETLVARDETLVSRDETLISREPLKRIFWNTLQAVSLIQRSFYLLNACTICAVFLHNLMQCIDSFSLITSGAVYVRKRYRCKHNPAILRFFLVTERTQLNAAHVYKCGKSKNCDSMWNSFLRNMPISQEPLVRISRTLARKYFRK